MLLANMAVAHKTYRAFPERALLRRHPPPQTKMLNDLMEFCDQMGLPMDFSSAGALNVSAGSVGEGETLGEKASKSQRPWPWAMLPTRTRPREASRHPSIYGQGSCGQGWAGLGSRNFQ